MSEAPMGYTVEFDIHDGQADAFEQTAEEMSQRVEKTEPGTILYQLFVSPDGESGRTVEGVESLP